VTQFEDAVSSSGYRNACFYSETSFLPLESPGQRAPKPDCTSMLQWMLPELLSESIVINAPGCECNEERDDPDIPSAVGRAKAGAKASCCSFLTQWVHEEASIAAHAGLLDERP